MPPGFLTVMSMNNLQLIIVRTGSLSTEGVRSYKWTSKVQREKLSDILNCTKKPCLKEESIPHTSKPNFIKQQQIQSSYLPENFNFHHCDSVTINFKSCSSISNCDEINLATVCISVVYQSISLICHYNAG